MTDPGRKRPLLFISRQAARRPHVTPGPLTRGSGGFNSSDGPGGVKGRSDHDSADRSSPVCPGLEVVGALAAGAGGEWRYSQTERGNAMSRSAITLLLLLLAPGALLAGVQEGLAAKKRGDTEAAIQEFTALAEQGDTRAMITIGLWYHTGDGVAQDYQKAMEWYIRAFERADGDAYNNIGVLYRDGLGVAVNRPIAYVLFLLTHLRGLGSDATQYRANANLRREVAETTDEVTSRGV